MPRPRIGVFVVVLALLAGALSPAWAAAQAPGGDPVLGEPAAFVGSEGAEIARITVEAMVDPFRDYESFAAPQRGYHYVLLRVSVLNEDSRPFTFDPNAIALQDRDGFLAYPTYVARSADATTADPDLAYGDIAGGSEARGVVVIPMINGADLQRVVYLPDRDRLVILADLRQQAGGAPATEAPAATEAPVATETATEAPTEAATEPAVTETAPTEAADVSGQALATYANPDFGFRLTYDPAVWTAQSSGPVAVILTDGESFAQVSGSSTLPTNAVECVAAEVAGLSATSSRQDYAPMLDASGAAIAGGDAQAAYAVYTFVGGRGEVFERVACLALPDGSGVVTILHNGPLEAFQSESARLEQLVNGLELG